VIKNGLYGLVSLSGAPLDRADCAVLGLAVPDPASPLALSLRDVSGEAADSGIAVRGDITLAFMGYLDNAPGLAAALGLAAGAEPAMLVQAALDQWGDAAFSRLRGDWSLLQFDRGRRVLCLAVSETMRDQMYVARCGDFVAVAPGATMLARLPWVGREFDPLGLICSMARWSYRRQREGRTFLQNVDAVECGTALRIHAGGQARSVFAVQPDFALWGGSYEDAVAALEAETRLAIRRQLHRHQSAAVLLSGGLDSSLLALLATQEKAPGQKLFALSSIARDGSGLHDEREYMRIVGDALGLEIVYLTPPEDQDAYLPDARIFAHIEEPVVGQRHYLYDAFYAAGVRTGATLLLDGVFGEMTLTRTVNQATPMGLYRKLRGEAREMVKAALYPPTWPHEGMLVTLAAPARALMVARFGTGPQPLPKVSAALRPNAPLGYAVQYFKSGKVPTATWYPTVRQAYPFRDRALLQLAARFPSRFTEGEGLPRSLARAMLRGRLPDRIAMRTSKDPFSPDFKHRLSTQAATARERLALHRGNGAGEWVDLKWAEAELTALAGGAMLVGAEWSRVQSTVIAAEFFTWWAEEARSGPGPV